MKIKEDLWQMLLDYLRSPCKGLGSTWVLGWRSSTGDTPSHCEDSPNSGCHNGEQAEIDQGFDIVKPQTSKDQQDAKELELHGGGVPVEPSVFYFAYPQYSCYPSISLYWSNTLSSAQALIK